MSVETVSLAELRKEIKARGWHRKAPFRILSELVGNLTVALSGIWIFVVYDDPVTCICAIVLSTAGSIGVATNTHTSSHYATSDKRRLNELLTFFGYPVFLGLSACHWWHQHIVMHHPAPNVIGVDADADLAPWFARTRDEVGLSNGLQRFYYERVQWLVFPLSLALIGFNMQMTGWRTLLGILCKPQERRQKHWIDLSAMLLHYVVWLVIPMVFFAPTHVVCFYLLRIGLMGYAMFLVLAPAHFPVEAVCLSGRGLDRDYLLLQTATTVNFRTGFLGRLMCSGLQYQIEHHLFPNLSHVYYPKVAPLVKKFCSENGLPYRSFRWDVVVWKCFLMLRSPSLVRRDLEAFRQKPGPTGAIGQSGAESLGGPTVSSE